MTDTLTLSELKKIHEALTKTKAEHTLNFRMIKSTKNLTLVNLYLIQQNEV